MEVCPLRCYRCPLYSGRLDRGKCGSGFRADSQTETIVAATRVFLNSLSSEQRKKVQFLSTPQKTATAAKFKGGMGGRMTFVGEQYGEAVWSNFPVSDVPCPGLALGSLSAAQRSAAMHALHVLLRPKGYKKVLANHGLR